MATGLHSDSADPFDLGRFVSAQSGVIEVALAELRQGQKESHWMWYVFPQLEGLGSSPTSRRYAIGSLAEAQAYLQHPVLGPRLLACCQALLSVKGKSAKDIMGYPDDAKLRSSATLFSCVPDAPHEFADLLRMYFAGQPDARTLELLKGSQ